VIQDLYFCFRILTSVSRFFIFVSIVFVFVSVKLFKFQHLCFCFVVHRDRKVIAANIKAFQQERNDFKSFSAERSNFKFPWGMSGIALLKFFVTFTRILTTILYRVACTCTSYSVTRLFLPSKLTVRLELVSRLRFVPTTAYNLPGVRSVQLYNSSVLFVWQGWLQRQSLRDGWS